MTAHDSPRPADVKICGREGIYEASEFWVEGPLFAARGRWRLSRSSGPHYVGDPAVRMWPLRSVVEIRVRARATDATVPRHLKVAA